MKQNEPKLELEFKTVENADQISSKILDDTIKGLGFAPNLYALMANNSALLDAYTYSYNTYSYNTAKINLQNNI